ncbi:unnamed protein product [Prorocentrum cordatum]|uniref:Uncharacterized protein n=1 Tax=Prorocentrum cordatum TaxID=2364126 RepID=A0ABN9S7V2_9DINO|nr:unnamed protein product [Polarella glacialis]
MPLATCTALSPPVREGPSRPQGRSRPAAGGPQPEGRMAAAAVTASGAAALAGPAGLLRQAPAGLGAALHDGTAAMATGVRGKAWWAGGPRKKGTKKRPKFISIGESLYRVPNYRLAFRRFFGKDVSEREMTDYARRQRYAVEKSKDANGKKKASTPSYAVISELSSPYSAARSFARPTDQLPYPMVE